MRQKYSREKRNCEVKRRNKTAVTRNWVFFERLHFLDSFIQPRSYVVVRYLRYAFVCNFNSCFRTYTNDRFVEEYDNTMLHENGLEDSNEAAGDASKTIDIEVEDGIFIDEYEVLSNDNHVTGLQDAYIELERSRNKQNISDHQQSDENIRNRIDRIVSEYSQEESTIEYQSPATPEVISNGNENGIIDGSGDVEMQQPSENSQPFVDENIVDMDNYVSQHPGCSSSFRTPTVPPYPSRCYDPKTGEIVIARVERTVSHTSIFFRCSMSLINAESR